MNEQGDEGALRPAGARRRSWKRSRRLWGLLGALCCLLAAVALALAGVNPFDPRLYDPFGGSGVSGPVLDHTSFDWPQGYNEPVSVCATHYTQQPWPGTCSQNDVVLSLSDASGAWVTFQIDPDLTGEGRPATVYLRQHDGHWRSFVTCTGSGGFRSCALPLPSIFQAVGQTLHAGMAYDVGVYVHEEFAVCAPLLCTPPPARPALPLLFTITR
jgi:hypothetical protein